MYESKLSCGKSYVAQTVCNINDQFREHTNALWASTGSNLAVHCAECLCSPAFGSTVILKHYREQRTREIHEAFVISTQWESTMSTPSVELFERELDCPRPRSVFCTWAAFIVTINFLYIFFSFSFWCWYIYSLFFKMGIGWRSAQRVSFPPFVSFSALFFLSRWCPYSTKQQDINGNLKEKRSAARAPCVHLSDLLIASLTVPLRENNFNSMD